MSRGFDVLISCRLPLSRASWQINWYKEEISRDKVYSSVYSTGGTTFSLFSRVSFKSAMKSRCLLFQHLHKLRCAAANRKVSLLFMPQVFGRHKENTTYLNWKTNELFWRLEWIFPQAQDTKCITDRYRWIQVISESLNSLWAMNNSLLCSL